MCVCVCVCVCVCMCVCVTTGKNGKPFFSVATTTFLVMNDLKFHVESRFQH